MKILWVSDSPTLPTGYGNITRNVCAGLADRGHLVSILGRGHQQGPIPWQNCVLYPGDYNTNADELLDYLRPLQPDVLITLGDVCRWSQYLIDSSPVNFMQSAGIPWVLYSPIDADMGKNGLPPSWVRILKSVDLPVAMSRYGRDVIQANGVIPAYIPFGVDTKVFQPPDDKELAKHVLGYEGNFVVLSDTRNTVCKMVPRILEIFRRFAADKDDVILHLHCNPDDPATRSPEYNYNLRSDIAFLNLTDKVSLTKDLSGSTELPIAQIVQMYQSADVHLLASSGETRGLSTLQATATGVVPLAAGYSANRELVLGHEEAINIHHLLPDEFGLHRTLIDIDDAVRKLEMLYQDRQLLSSKAQKSREFALSYDWEGIVSQWEELLQNEVQHRRTSQHSSARASGIPLDPHGEERSSNIAHTEHNARELEAELHQDTHPERTLTIPVTLPLARSKQRLTGYVYVASQHDVPSVLILRRIFPGLQFWSTIPLDFGFSVSNGELLQAKVVSAKSNQYRPNLALSTLACDMGSFDPVLPIEAAKLGVPCIGSAQQREQAKLWPELSLAKPDPLVVAELGRQMLTDQGIATDLCSRARQRLAGALVGSGLQVH